MKFIIGITIKNPANNIFRVNGEHPAALQKGDVVELGPEGSTKVEELNPGEREIVRISGHAILKYDEKTLARVRAEAELEARNQKTGGFNSGF